jgi:hypothetical protein
MRATWSEAGSQRAGRGRRRRRGRGRPGRRAGCRKVAQDSRTTQERAGDVCAASVSGEWRQGRRSCQAEEEEASIIVAGWPCGKCDFNRGVNW